MPHVLQFFSKKTENTKYGIIYIFIGKFFHSRSILDLLAIIQMKMWRLQSATEILKRKENFKRSLLKPDITRSSKNR